MQSNEIRKKFLDFFEKKGHKILPSSSLIPENDPSVLFTTAGMQQFKPYYTGEKNAEVDFGSLNTTTAEKCIRTSDIDEVGDNSHLTFFEMLGNFSFGGYGKKEAIQYAHEFITKILKLPISYVTIFEGKGSIERDNESEKIWKELGIKNIKEEGMKDVFWGPTGGEGPCGPTTEIYCKNATGQDVEIWNIVFNQYYCTKDKQYKPLDVKGIDTGMGFERLLTVIQNKESVYETDLFSPFSNVIDLQRKEGRIIADHIKAAIFLITDGVKPSNVDRGYVLRRLIRRAVVFSHKINFDSNLLSNLVDTVSEIYKGVYLINASSVKNVLITEIEKFKNTLDKGLKQFEKGLDPFVLFTTYGFPIELTLELAKEKGITVDVKNFEEKFKKHQEISRIGSEHKFKGGLADHDPKTIKLHTAHHILLAALQEVLGKQVKQRGSNITQERLRLDFSFDRKLTDEEKGQIEEIVNQKIKESLPVIHKELPKVEAEKLGAEMEFGAKYGDVVSVYLIGKEDNLYSKEFCGGPHVGNTSELGQFKIAKEEAVAAGIRRIKGVLV